MNHRLSSKGIFYRHNTVSQSHAAVHERAVQNERTKFFFSLPPSSVSRLVTPAARPKRGEVLFSALTQGDIVAAPYELVDQSGVEHYLLGEVGKADVVEKTLSIHFFSDGESDDFSWRDQDTTNILKVNDVTAGDLFKTCGALAIGRRLFVGHHKNPAETDAPEKQYLPVTITGYDAKTQQHQLQLPSEKLSLDLSKADVRLVQPPATDTTETPSSPSKTGGATRTTVTRTAAQLPVHIDTAHTAKARSPKPLRAPTLTLMHILALHIPPTSTP